jgi:2-polyprenyl-3-methyl-5-hydroxy-6-metoxy-1,4-benzoquinol methylase
LNHRCTNTTEGTYPVMAPMIKRKTEILPRAFYNELAEEYDGMTGFEQRLPRELPFFRTLVQSYSLKSALDAGCGTGFHSVLLSQLGVQVTAADVSERMLVQTRKHAKEYGFDIKTIKSALPFVHTSVHKIFDSVFCLGNTLAHLVTEKELLGSLKAFYRMLNSEGILFLQILNYDRILVHHERIQNVRETKDGVVIRFYDYESKSIRFNILRIKKKKKGVVHTLHSVMLYPWKSSDIVRLVKRAGFSRVDIFGSIALEKYHEQSSKDLIVLAQRGSGK